MLLASDVAHRPPEWDHVSYHAHIPEPPGRDPNQPDEIPPPRPPEEDIDLPPREEPPPVREPDPSRPQ